MIAWGVVLLVIGIIFYALAHPGGRSITPPFVGTVGWVVAAVGALLLVLGILFLLVPGIHPSYVTTV